METEPPAADSAARLGLARLYRHAGLFAWAAHLQRLGVTSPARMVHIIGRTLAQAWPELPATPATPALLGELLLAAHRRFANEPLLPLATLSAAAAPVLPWNAQDTLAELMAVHCGPAALRTVRGRLAAKGLAVNFAELHDLSALFASGPLLAALASFDMVKGENTEAAWLSTVFYRFALKHVLTTTRLHESLSLAFELPEADSAPEDVIARRTRDAALQALPATLATLQPLQREAVRRYFGLDCHEHTLLEVAQALSTNVYFARAAVAGGVGALAAGLGIPGLLDGDELQLARLLFTDSLDIASAAKVLGLAPAQVRHRATRIGNKLRGSLRARTTAPPPDEEETSMEPQPFDARSLGLFVSAFKADLVTLRRDGHGALWSSVTGVGEHRAAAVLDALRQHPELMDDLLSASPAERLAELFTPNPPSQRGDLLPDQQSWATLLNQASAGALANAAAILAEASPEMAGAAPENAVLRLRDALSAVTAALEEMLPWSSRVAGVATLQLIARPAADVKAYWGEGTREHETSEMDLTGLVRDRLDLVGNFDGALLDRLTAGVLRGLCEQTIVLPGFGLAPARREGRVAFQWRRPDLEPSAH